MGTCSGQLEREQTKLGPQSYRGNPDRRPMEKLEGNEYALDLFQSLFQKEEKLCGRFAVFYHSYSHAALLYEVRAAAASLLHGYSAAAAPLPRLLAQDFSETPSAAELMQKVVDQWGPTRSDHHPEFRRVGISAMCSLLATGPECCMQVAFFEGYSCKKIAFRAVLEEELRTALCITSDKASALVDRIMELAGRHGLDTSILGGQPSPSGHAGHILQIFIRRDLLDRLCYPALPYGEIDKDRLPMSEWLSGDRSFSWGQARILALPKLFMDPQAVKMFTISADPTFHGGRAKFQQELKELLRVSKLRLNGENRGAGRLRE